MKYALLFSLVFTAPAHAMPYPAKLACGELSYTIVCNPNLPMPCPHPPLPYPRDFAEVPLAVSKGAGFESARGQIAQPITIEGEAFKVLAVGGYVVNADGTQFQPNLQLSLTDSASGWTSETIAEPGQATLRLTMNRQTKLGDTGKVSSATGIVICELR